MYGLSTGANNSGHCGEVTVVERWPLVSISRSSTVFQTGQNKINTKLGRYTDGLVIDESGLSVKL